MRIIGSAMSRCFCVAAAMSLGVPAIAQAPSGGAAIASPATDAELEQARGGLVWAVVLVGLRAGQVTIRVCGSRSGSCVRGAAAVFTSARAARQWACRRHRRFC